MAIMHDETSLVLQRVKYEESYHLFIDDIDKFKPTEFKSEVLFGLIDTMYRRSMTLTVTSNMDIRTLVDQEKLNPGIIRRIDDMCLVVRL